MEDTERRRYGGNRWTEHPGLAQRQTGVSRPDRTPGVVHPAGRPHHNPVDIPSQHGNEIETRREQVRHQRAKPRDPPRLERRASGKRGGGAVERDPVSDDGLNADRLSEHRQNISKTDFAVAVDIRRHAPTDVDGRGQVRACRDACQLRVAPQAASQTPHSSSDAETPPTAGNILSSLPSVDRGRPTREGNPCAELSESRPSSCASDC